MTRALTHEEASAMLDAAALDALDPQEREAVLAHLAGCQSCRAELEAVRATASHLAFAAPVTALGVDARERIHTRLMDRIAADARARGVVPLRPSPTSTASPESARPVHEDSRAWRRSQWLAIAAGVLFVVTAALYANAARERQSLRDVLRSEMARAEGTRNATDSLRTIVALRDSMITGLVGRDVAVVSLTANGAKAPFARMFWDTAHNTWTLVAHNMPALKPGRTYQLWLVTRSAKISAGTFTPTNGDAIVRATYPLARDSLQAIAITEEPAGGVPQPTGAMVVAGEAKSTNSP
jgi:hypothetical protein